MRFHLHGKLYKPVPKQFEDLLEIATYVYCPDQATSRGLTSLPMIPPWIRIEISPQ